MGLKKNADVELFCVDEKTSSSNLLLCHLYYCNAYTCISVGFSINAK